MFGFISAPMAFKFYGHLNFLRDRGGDGASHFPLNHSQAPKTHPPDNQNKRFDVAQVAMGFPLDQIRTEPPETVHASQL